MNHAILRHQLQKTPCIAPCDAVKLLYQQAFGCGHLLADPSDCIQHITNEIGALDGFHSAQIAEFIGHGLCRLNLNHQDVASLPPSLIEKMMRITQDVLTPDQARFESSLHTLQAVADTNVLPFDGASLAHYLKHYRSQGFPLVSHSQMYRDAYKPAYRVVLADFAMLLPLIQTILSMKEPVFVVIDGDCGGGKTTLADRLATLLGGEILHMDDFFLPPSMRTDERLLVPGGNVHYERFFSQILTPLLMGQTDLLFDRFSCRNNETVKTKVSLSKRTIIEGSYSHHPTFDHAYQTLHAIKVFVCVDESHQHMRLRARNETMFDRFISTFIPLEKSFQQAYDIRTKADIIISSSPWEWEDEHATDCH